MRDRLRVSEEQCPVQTEGGDGVSGLKAPTGEEGLHDLEAVRHPVHEAMQDSTHCLLSVNWTAIVSQDRAREGRYFGASPWLKGEGSKSCMIPRPGTTRR